MKLPWVKRSTYDQAVRDENFARGEAAYLTELLEAIASNRQVMRVIDTGYPAPGKTPAFPYPGGTLGTAIRKRVDVSHPHWPPRGEERKKIIDEANRKLAELPPDDPGPIRMSNESDFDYAVRVVDG